MKLLFNTLLKYILGLILVGTLLFIPAGTIKYWNAWLFIGLLFIPMFILGVILLIKNKELLSKRLNAKEKEREQKYLIAISCIIFLSGFIVAGFDFKYSWSKIPNVIVIIFSTIQVISYLIYIEVMKENAYLSRTVEIQENQKVIDVGLYGIVRHPMYFATIMLYLSFPIVLGSIYSLAIFSLFIVVLVIRIINEEKVLSQGLEGYNEYMKKVKYRLIPFIW